MRTHFCCLHPHSKRRVYDGHCEVCWSCRSSRVVTDRWWPPVCRWQHPDGSMTTTDGVLVAERWADPVPALAPRP